MRGIGVYLNMKIKEMRVNQKVYDRWYPELGGGIVLKVLKTRCHISYNRGFYDPNPVVWIYDISHLQFLEKTK